MKKGQKNINEKQDLIVNGKIVKFHYDRDERLSLMQNKPKNSSSFFGKKYRYLHFILIDIIALFLIGYFIYFMGHNENKVVVDGFKYQLTKKTNSKKKLLNFIFKVKNVSDTSQSLIQEEVITVIKDKDKQVIFEKSFFLTKLNYREDEEYSESFVVDTPKKGKYSVALMIGGDENKMIYFKFKVKR